MRMHQFIAPQVSQEGPGWASRAKDALSSLNGASTSLFAGFKPNTRWTADLSYLQPALLRISLHYTGTNIPISVMDMDAPSELLESFRKYRDAIVTEIELSQSLYHKSYSFGAAWASDRIQNKWRALEQARSSAHENGRLYLYDLLVAHGLSWSTSIIKDLFVVFAYIYLPDSSTNL
jgi:hypothetical protein